MAMLSAYIEDTAAAQRVMDIFIKQMGATPRLVIANPESARPGSVAESDAATDDAIALPNADGVRVSIYDVAIDVDAARKVLEDAGAIDIRPIQR